MSFKENSSRQMTLADSFLNLTAREKKALENSWAQIFADDIFPNIDEKRFSVLYSDNGSPNTPVNVIVGALIIKEIFDYSDDEMVENLMLDLHMQYALHTTSFPEQPLSDKTLSRFRRRCYDYESLHGKDLYRDCVKGLSSSIQKIMNINGRVRRMDSMMIESNIRKLSRVELLYTCVARLATAIHKLDEKAIPESLSHYTDPNDFNRVMYHQRSTQTQERLETILADADSLLALCAGEYDTLTEYDLLVRCLSEQTVLENGKRRLRTKKDGGLDSHALQNPSDPEATFREKDGKEHRGYVANMEETVGPEGSVITDYQYGQNTNSDSAMLKEHLEQMEPAEEPVLLVADGAYYGDENTKLAADKNVQLVTTSLTGVATPDIVADFEFSEDGKQVLSCPAGHAPKSCCYRNSNGKCHVSFPLSCCAECPRKKECNPHIHKQTASLDISQKGRNRARTQRAMKEEVYKDYARLRNGVETVPSNLRRNFHLEKLPRGIRRGKFFFGAKIAALNFRKLFNYKKGFRRYAKNPVFA